MENPGPKNPKFIEKQIQSKKVCQYSLDRDFIKMYDSLADAAKAVNGHTSGICRVLKGEKKSTKGFM